MARYVLVEFDDNAAAQRFVEKVNGSYAPAPDTPNRRVRAIWGKPTRFCECVTADKGGKPFTRGAKSGWWVHAACGRPTRVWAEGAHWFSSLGRNLLPGNTDHVPRGWGLDQGLDIGIIPVGPEDADGIDMARVARKGRARARKQHPRRQEA